MVDVMAGVFCAVDADNVKPGIEVIHIYNYTSFAII